MRVAISGTHFSGKSTLLAAFLLDHPDYIHEPEAYDTLLEIYGEAFLAEPAADDFFRQLEYHLERLKQYRAGERVIFKRCAADYLAYILALQDLGREGFGAELVPPSIELARDGLGLLDLIVYLPALDIDDDELADEDPQLRQAMNTRLEAILLDDELRLLTSDGPTVIEATGSTSQRLKVLENARR